MYGLGQTVQGYELQDTWHFDVTATQVFANVLKASQGVVVLEAGADWVPGLQNKLSGGPEGFGLRYDGPGTNLSGNPNLGGYPEFPAVNGQCVQGTVGRIRSVSAWLPARRSPRGSPGDTCSPADSSTTT